MNDELIKRCQLWLKDISFENYTFKIKEGHGGVFLTGHYMERDVVTGEVSEQITRKWPISPYVTKSEFVQTVFKCCMTSAEHRVREAFRYKNMLIFGPHFDVDDLHTLCRSGRGDSGGRSPSTEGKDVPEPPMVGDGVMV